MAIITQKKFLSIAHGQGAAATHIARVALFGSRRAPATSASTALPQNSASGIGLHSVFEGPKVRRNGGPAVKRERSA